MFPEVELVTLDAALVPILSVRYYRGARRVYSGADRPRLPLP